MVGLFDSGSGGLNTVRYIKEHYPCVDLVYFIDRNRAPYGTKTKEELIGITCENIDRLIDMGAERVLIACCTASTVHKLLPTRYRDASLPIISEVAKRAECSTTMGRIGVIATNHTVNTHAFSNALPSCDVYELAIQELVEMIDGGLNDTSITDNDKMWLTKALQPILTVGIDTLILGCTHFPMLRGAIEEIAAPYGVKTVIDSARVGAEVLISELLKQKIRK